MNLYFALIALVAIITYLVLRNPTSSKASKIERSDFVKRASDLIDADDVSAVIEQSPEGVDFNYDVVGESFQRGHLMALVRSHNAFEIGEIYGTAILEPEPTNEFDPTAVKVVVEGVQVGYIPKFDSPAVTQMIQENGKKSFEVPVRIGFDTNSPQPLIGARLALKLS